MIFTFLFFILLYFFLNQIFIKKNILIDKIETSSHKSKVATIDKTPLTGGLIFVIFLFFYANHRKQSFDNFIVVNLYFRTFV